MRLSKSLINKQICNVGMAGVSDSWLCLLVFDGFIRQKMPVNDPAVVEKVSFALGKQPVHSSQVEQSSDTDHSIFI